MIKITQKDKIFYYKKMEKHLNEKLPVLKNQYSNLAPDEVEALLFNKISSIASKNNYLKFVIKSEKEGRLKSYLLRIFFNSLNSFYRKNKKEHEQLKPIKEDLLQAKDNTIIQEEEREMKAQTHTERVQIVEQLLTTKQFDFFIKSLCEDGLSIAEIAAKKNVSKQSLYKRQNIILKKLKDNKDSFCL